MVAGPSTDDLLAAMAKHRANGRSGKEPRHVRLYHSMMKTEAWKSLSCVERCVYIELAKRYGGSNNGRIACSLKQLVDALGISKSTAQRALNSLQDRGFISLMKRGGFNMKTRHATEWRLTEHKCDVTGNLATKDFERWEEKSTGTVMKPHGYSHETRRVLSRNPLPRKSPSTVSPEYP